MAKLAPEDVPLPEAGIKKSWRGAWPSGSVLGKTQEAVASY